MEPLRSTSRIPRAAASAVIPPPTIRYVKFGIVDSCGPWRGWASSSVEHPFLSEIPNVQTNGQRNSPAHDEAEGGDHNHQGTLAQDGRQGTAAADELPDNAGDTKGKCRDEQVEGAFPQQPEPDSGGKVESHEGQTEESACCRLVAKDGLLLLRNRINPKVNQESGQQTPGRCDDVENEDTPHPSGANPRRWHWTIDAHRQPPQIVCVSASATLGPYPRDESQRTRTGLRRNLPAALRRKSETTCLKPRWITTGNADLRGRRVGMESPPGDRKVCALGPNPQDFVAILACHHADSIPTGPDGSIGIHVPGAEAEGTRVWISRRLRADGLCDRTGGTRLLGSRSRASKGQHDQTHHDQRSDQQVPPAHDLKLPDARRPLAAAASQPARDSPA